MLVRIYICTALALVLVLSGCDNEGSPYLAIRGGGFVFNYRIAEVFYGCVVVPTRKLPENSKLVAVFESPAGGKPYRFEKQVKPGDISYEFQTPPLSGVKKDVAYTVTVHLIDTKTGKEIETAKTTYTSLLDQSVNPSVPPVIGPGYTPNPAAPKN